MSADNWASGALRAFGSGGVVVGGSVLYGSTVASDPLSTYVNPIPPGLAFTDMDVAQLKETAKQLRWELSAMYRADNGNSAASDVVVAELLEVKALIEASR